MKLYHLAMLGAVASAPALAVPTVGGPIAPLDSPAFAVDVHDEHAHAQGSPSFSDIAHSPPGLLLAPQHAQEHGAPTPVPEPRTWALMLAGFGALGYLARRHRRR